MRKILLTIVSMVIVVVALGQSKTTATSAQSSDKAYMSLATNEVNFKEIAKGDSKTMEVKFTNTGERTLAIYEVYTNCGCTTIDCPEEPFAPGKSGVLKISYNATEEGPFKKTIAIYSNASNKQETIKIEGIVIEK